MKTRKYARIIIFCAIAFLFSGCVVKDYILSIPSNFYIFQFKGEVGQNVIVCNPHNQDCITDKTPDYALYGLVRSGAFQQGQEPLCYSFVEDCLNPPQGPLLAGGEIVLWKYNGDSSQAGGIIGKAQPDERGYYFFDPPPGIYWMTYNANGNHSMVKGYEKIFPNTQFHFIVKVEIKKDEPQKKTIYLKQ